MKKLIALAAAALCFAAVASAQPKAIGLRATYGAELSYQQYSGANFWEFDLGLFNNMLDVIAVYDFKLGDAGPLTFYAGPGAYVAMWPSNGQTLLHAGLVGQIGFEHTFDSVPIQLSLDWRPMFNFVDGFGWNGYGAALGIRYAF